MNVPSGTFTAAATVIPFPRAAASGTRSVWLFPGLGSRYVGMGGDIIGQHASADRIVSQASRWLGYDVRAVCIEGSGRKRVPSRIEAQVVYVIGCAYVEVLAEQRQRPAAVCGHSLGTWAAAYAAGVYDFFTGLGLVTRAEDLLAARPSSVTEAMGVVLGLPLETVRDLAVRFEHLHLANQNSPGQYVVAGDAKSVAAFLHGADQAGAYKTKHLGVRPAFHTPRLAGVCAKLGRELADVGLRTPRVPLVSAADGGLLTTATQIRQHLGEFLSLPVDWERAVRGIIRGRLGSAFWEVGAGTVLTDMMAYIDRSVTVQTASDVLREVVTG